MAFVPQMTLLNTIMGPIVGEQNKNLIFFYSIEMNSYAKHNGWCYFTVIHSLENVFLFCYCPL